MLNEKTSWWDLYDEPNIEYLGFNNESKTWDPIVPAGIYIRGVMVKDYNGIVYSYPFYFYTGNEKCHAKNIVTGINGITVISDKPCFYYVCASDIGYGKDITAWERKGARSGYGASTMGNVDTSLVQPGEYYVVIARFADNTYLMTDMMCKTE